MRRIADRATDIAAGLERRHAGRERRRRAAGRAAGRALQVPRIVGRAVDLVVALEVLQVRGHVRLAEDHRAGVEQTVDHDGVRRSDIVPELGQAPGRGPAGDVVGVLDRHRQAVQRTPILAAPKRLVGRARARPRPLDVEMDDGVEGAVEPLDARQIVLQQLQATDLAPLDPLCQPVGGREGDVVHVA